MVARTVRSLSLALVLGLSLGGPLGCASSSKLSTAPRDRERDAEVGKASFYADKFHGRRTASGERYDADKLTAAHPTLPHGSRIRVTNLENGRAVELRVNDRGPFVKGRIVDVSYAAAEKLGFVRQGLARVRVEVLALGEPPAER